VLTSLDRQPYVQIATSKIEKHDTVRELCHRGLRRH